MEHVAQGRAQNSHREAAVLRLVVFYLNVVRVGRDRVLQVLDHYLRVLRPKLQQV
jgi:hypothetical protein